MYPGMNVPVTEYAVVIGVEPTKGFGVSRPAIKVEVVVTIAGEGTNVVARKDAQSEARRVLAG